MDQPTDGELDGLFDAFADEMRKVNGRAVILRLE